MNFTFAEAVPPIACGGLLWDKDKPCKGSTGTLQSAIYMNDPIHSGAAGVLGSFSEVMTVERTEFAMNNCSSDQGIAGLLLLTAQAPVMI